MFSVDHYALGACPQHHVHKISTAQLCSSLLKFKFKASLSASAVLVEWQDEHPTRPTISKGFHRNLWKTIG